MCKWFRYTVLSPFPLALSYLGHNLPRPESKPNANISTAKDLDCYITILDRHRMLVPISAHTCPVTTFQETVTHLQALNHTIRRRPRRTSRPCATPPGGGSTSRTYTHTHEPCRRSRRSPKDHSCRLEEKYTCSIASALAPTLAKIQQRSEIDSQGDAAHHTAQNVSAVARARNSSYE